METKLEIGNTGDKIVDSIFGATVYNLTVVWFSLVERRFAWTIVVDCWNLRVVWGRLVALSAAGYEGPDIKQLNDSLTIQLDTELA